MQRFWERHNYELTVTFCKGWYGLLLTSRVTALCRRQLNVCPIAEIEVDYQLRKASLTETSAIGALIARSARELSGNDYTSAQIEGALTWAFGVDTSLIRDQTYFVVVADTGALVACGGWSKRRTLFGSDTRAERDDGWLDPQVDAAKIRAFFVDPAHVRRGLGRLMLEHCEAEAARNGFSRFELMATLPGKRLYERCGYAPLQPVSYPLPGGERITFVPMWKAVGSVGSRRG
jgi:GNAT superfamily N-acetyltransferase